MSQARVWREAEGTEGVCEQVRNYMNINLTDPQLAHLVARYRAWVEEQNRKNSKPIEGMLPGTDMPCAMYFVANYKGFLDWAIREGIEVPEKEAV